MEEFPELAIEEEDTNTITVWDDLEDEHADVVYASSKTKVGEEMF